MTRPTVFYVQQADGAPEAVVATSTDREAVREAIVQAGMSHMALAWRVYEGSWLASGPTGESPVDALSVPGPVRQLAKAVGPWEPTHVADGGPRPRYLFAPQEDGGPAYTMREWVNQAEPEFERRDGAWHYQGARYGGRVAGVDVAKPKLPERALGPAGAPFEAAQGLVSSHVPSPPSPAAAAAQVGPVLMQPPQVGQAAPPVVSPATPAGLPPAAPVPAGALATDHVVPGVGPAAGAPASGPGVATQGWAPPGEAERARAEAEARTTAEPVGTRTPGDVTRTPGDGDRERAALETDKAKAERALKAEQEKAGAVEKVDEKKAAEAQKKGGR